jgi:ATP-dependent RNA helicase RhlE
VYEDYVHRIGRTGRALQAGEAVTFCNPTEVYYMGKIQKLIRQTVDVYPIPEGVFIEETPYDERQDQNREIDLQKRKEDPDFKGAFHEKKTLSQHKKFDAKKLKANPRLGSKNSTKKFKKKH